MCFPQYPDWLPALIHPTRCNNFDLMNLEASEYLTRNWASTPINFDFWGMINNVARNVDISMRNNYCCGGGIFNTYYANGFGGGGYFSGDYFTRTSSPSTSEKKSPEKEKLDNLKGVLDDFLNKSSEIGLDDSDKKNIKADIDSIMNNTDYTDAEKYEEIQKVYEQIKNNTEFKNYLTTCRKFKVLGKSQSFEMYMGDLSEANLDAKVSLDAMLSSLDDGQANTDALQVINKENVLPLINSLNTGTESFAQKLQNGIKELNDNNAKDTALSNVYIMTDALIEQAKEVKDRLDNPDIITNCIDDLKNAVSNTPGKLNFADKFDTLYAVTRTAMVKIIEKEFIDNCKDIQDEDFVNELISDEISDALKDIDPSLINDITIKEKDHYKPTQVDDNDDKESNKSGEEILNDLENSNALKSTGDKVDGKNIYEAANGELYVLGDDKLFYKVTVETDTNGQKTYSVDFETTGLNASKIRKIKTDSDKKEAEKERRKGIIDTINNESEEAYHLTEIGGNAEFTGTGNNGTTVNESYTVYKGTDDKYYILNDDGKLVEVEKKNNAYKVKTNATAITYDRWKHNLQREEEQKKTNAVKNLTNPLGSNTNLCIIKNMTIGKGSDKWTAKRNINEFRRHLRKQLKAFATPSNPDIDSQAWMRAYDKLAQYYMDLYSSLAEQEYDNKKVSFSKWVDEKYRAKEKISYGEPNMIEKITTESNETVGVRITGDQYNTDDYGEVVKNDNKSSSGMYIGCDFDCSWGSFLGFGHKNEYSFFLDGNTVFEKFKEFLKEELK